MSICCFPKLCSSKSSSKFKNKSQDYTSPNIQSQKISPLKIYPKFKPTRLSDGKTQNLKLASNDLTPCSIPKSRHNTFNFPAPIQNTRMLNLSTISKHSMSDISNLDALNDIIVELPPDHIATSSHLSLMKRNIRKFNEFTNKKRSKIQIISSILNQPPNLL